jgi:hypothetical protein
MKYRKLTSDGDYSFGNGLADFYINVPEAVAQAVETRILLWRGEWFLNIDEGTPFLEAILGKHSKEVADVTLQDRVQDTQGMVNIENYASIINPDTRAMTVEMEIDTIYGPTSVDLANFRNF